MKTPSAERGEPLRMAIEPRGYLPSDQFTAPDAPTGYILNDMDRATAPLIPDFGRYSQALIDRRRISL